MWKIIVYFLEEANMPIFVFLIILSFSFYVYYKVKYVRSRRPMERRMLSGKSRMALGLFVALFGINQLFLFNTTVTYIVAAVFILVGGLSAWAGFKHYRHHLPYAEKEAEQWEQQQN
jgi:phosphatidylglycerophosphate synthase